MNFITKIEVYISLSLTELWFKFYASNRATCVCEWSWTETWADND